MDKEKRKQGFVVWPFVAVGAGIGVLALLAKSAGPAMFGWVLDVGTNVGGSGVAGSAGAGGAAGCPDGTRSVYYPPSVDGSNYWPNPNGLGCPVDPINGGIDHSGHPDTSGGGTFCVPNATPSAPSVGGSGSPSPEATPTKTWGQAFDDWVGGKIKDAMDPNNYGNK